MPINGRGLCTDRATAIEKVQAWNHIKMSKATKHAYKKRTTPWWMRMYSTNGS